MKKTSLIFTLLILMTGLVQGQGGGRGGQPAGSGGQPQRPYSIVIKGGHVIDPKNNINEVMDIAITPARQAVTARAAIPAQEAVPAQGNQPARPAIAAQPAREASPAVPAKVGLVAKNIDPALGNTVVSAQGMYVVPGLIDLHTHVYYGFSRPNYLSDGSVAVLPDTYAIPAGVTTVVDAGGAGWKSFDHFKKNIIDLSITRVLSLINIVGTGMRGPTYEQNLEEMDAKKAAEAALANKEHVVGFKLAHWAGADWRTPVSRVVEAGKIANMPVMIDFGGDAANGTPPSIEELFTKFLRPGDIYTHTYTLIANRREPVVDPATNQVKQFVRDAQKRGIIFDVGFGSGSFAYPQAIPAIKQGFFPNTMGTDLHAESVIGSMKDPMNMYSIFLAMGMDLQSIIKAGTWASAQAIKREELGHLSPGAIADIAILSIRDGNFAFKDVPGNRQTGTKRFECQMTIKGGRIWYDLNALAANNTQR